MIKFGLISVMMITLLAFSSASIAKVRLHSVFSDNMVLQRDQPITIFGEANPGELLTIQFAGIILSVNAGKDGFWSVDLPSQGIDKKGKTLIVAGENVIELHHILIGDVWLCSGQSNMEFALRDCDDSAAVAAADYPLVRFVRIPYTCKDRPQRDIDTEQLQWSVCSPSTAADCSAVGFYFARKIVKEVDVPIGILISSVGGTNIEKWMPQPSFARNPLLKEYQQKVDGWMQQYQSDLIIFQTPMKRWIKEVNKALKANDEIPQTPYLPLHPSMPGSKYGGGQFSHLYNGMIAPLHRLKIKGALWYQGENNGEEEVTYTEKKRELIASWRQEWGVDFPFYFVQLSSWLASTNLPNEERRGWQYCRSGQLACVNEIPNTGMAVTYDIGDAEDIHPKNKMDVGERLALWALARDYGQKVVYSGPLFKSAVQEEGRMRVLFEHTGSGLMTGCKKGVMPVTEDIGGELRRFAIAGEDKQWHWADATIQDDCVIVSSPKVSRPVAVRYAFSMNPEGANLYNREGLPASPFRSDTW